MNAVQILGPPTSPTITLTRTHPLPTPPTTTTTNPSTPSTTDLLIRVHSAGLTADELSWPETYNHRTNPSQIPGHDISGVVAAPLPPSYPGPLAVGDAVYAMLHADRGQGQADYVYTAAEGLARKPRGVTHAVAAALPIPVLTAWEGLFARALLQPRSELGSRSREGGEDGKGGQKVVLVTGASGAVGSMVVQIAKKVAGAKVVALASKGKHGYLRGLGADVTVDYAVDGWEREVGERSVDVVFDSVGGQVLAKAWSVVKDDGVVVTVADPPPAWAFDKTVVPMEADGRPGVRYIYFVVSPDGEALTKIGGLIDEGTLKPLPVVEFGVDKAVEAWEFAKQRGRQGKVVVNFVTDDA